MRHATRLNRGRLGTARTAGPLAVALVALLAVVPARADTERELAAAEQRLATLLDRMDQGRSRIDQLEAEASAIAARIGEVETRVELIQADVVQKEYEIRQAQGRLNLLQAELDERARMAYEIGAGSSLEFLLGSASLTDLGDRIEIVNNAAEADQDLIDRVEDERVRLIVKTHQLQRLKAEMLSKREELVAQRSALEERLVTARTVLARVAADEREASRLVKDLRHRRAAEILAAQLAAEQASAERDATVIGPVEGVFAVCPVDHPHAYSDDFGAPRRGHRHQGNDVFAPKNTPIRAPFRGFAEKASNRLGGKAVKVYGDDGYVYNAHLSKLGTLGRVKAGTVIGFVGTTGNARGTSPHNHFEWHPGNGEAVNPFPFLNTVC